MKIAIIGSGISGLVCAHKLQHQHDITLFEANDYLGGHTHTISVARGEKNYNIDTGFIVFNKRTYPNFIALLKELQIPYQTSEMSFSVRDPIIDFEYNGNDLNSLFAQRRNVLNKRFYQLIGDIIKFNRLLKTKVISNQINENLVMQDFFEEHPFGNYFVDYYLLPMASAIWSTQVDDVLQFPLKFIAEFYYNHGLLNIINRPQWYVVKGGSEQYVKAIENNLKARVKLNSPITEIQRREKDVIVNYQCKNEAFDKVIIATHSDQALKLLSDPSEEEQAILSQILYTKNDVILHTDDRLLPKRKKAWASWNYYLSPGAESKSGNATLCYYMNRLQKIKSKENFIVSVNQRSFIDQEKIISEHIYTHPLFSAEAFQAQKQHHKINGVNHTYFCGAYWGYGFHEDGVKSALKVIDKLIGETP